MLHGYADIVAALLRKRHKDLVLASAVKIKAVIEAALYGFKSGGTVFALKSHFVHNFEEVPVGSRNIRVHFEVVRLIFFCKDVYAVHQVGKHGFIVQIADGTPRRIKKACADKRNFLYKHRNSAHNRAFGIAGNHNLVLPVVFYAVPACGLGKAALGMLKAELFIFRIKRNVKNLHFIPP